MESCTTNPLLDHTKRLTQLRIKILLSLISSPSHLVPTSHPHTSLTPTLHPLTSLTPTRHPPYLTPTPYPQASVAAAEAETDPAARAQQLNFLQQLKSNLEDQVRSVWMKMCEQCG